MTRGLVAIVLLQGGGLAALQAASVSAGLPFAVVLLLGTFALIKGLLAEPRPRRAASWEAASCAGSGPERRTGDAPIRIVRVGLCE